MGSEKNEKRTKKQKRINTRKSNSYSSLYSIASFFASLSYLIADIIFDNRISAIIAFAILWVTFFICEISVRFLRKTLAVEDKRAKKIYDSLANHAKLIGYLSYILLAFSLITAMII